MSEVRIYLDANGEWVWTRRASSGATEDESPQGYVTEAQAFYAAQERHPGVAIVVID